METLSVEAREKHDRQLKSEERRALIWIGILAIVVAFDFWLRDGNPNPNPTFNFLCNYPCPHVTFPWLPFLDFLSSLWLLYAISLLVYSSQDIFRSPTLTFAA